MKKLLLDPEWVKQETQATLERLAKNAPQADFVPFAADVIYGLIKKKPIRYRTYGPYWWALKDVLIAQGHLIGNFDTDNQLKVIYRGENDAETIVAADAFAKKFKKTHLITNNVFVLDDSGESYTLFDSDLESL